MSAENLTESREAAKHHHRKKEHKKGSRRRHEDDKGSGCKQRKQQQEEATSKSGKQLVTQRPGRGSAVALAVVASWAVVRSGVQVFHLARRRQLAGMLTDLAAALTALSQVWWLDYGGLLGIHRDGDLILHDSDIDLAVWQPDWDALEQGLRAQLGGRYAMARLVPSEDPSACFLRLYCPLGMADVFGAAEVPGQPERLVVDCGHGTACSSVTTASIFPLGQMQYAGAAISVPGDVEALLEQRYGNWRVPRYLDKGADTIEHNKWHNKLLRGIRYCTGISV